MVPCYLVTTMAVTECWSRHDARALARELGLGWGQYAVVPVNETDDEADAERVAAAKRAIAANGLLIAALERVQSASVRAWACTAHNRPILVKLASMALAKQGPSASPDMFAAFITASAIGL